MPADPTYAAAPSRPRSRSDRPVRPWWSRRRRGGPAARGDDARDGRRRWSPDARMVLLKGWLTSAASASSRNSPLDQGGAAGRPSRVRRWSSTGASSIVRFGSAARSSGSPRRSPTPTSPSPRGSRIGAWASPQSEAIPDRAALEARVSEVEARFADTEIPRPENWGGFRVEPLTVEFWQGAVDRLHDRFRYRRLGGGEWAIERLAP